VTVTPTFVQQTTVLVGAGKTSTTSFYTPSVSGNLLILATTQDNQSSNVVSISDNKGNVYSPAISGVNWGTVGNEARSELWYAKNINGGGTPISVTIKWSSPPRQFVELYLSEYSGLDRVAPLDQTSTHSGPGYFSGVYSSGFKTTTSSNELVFGHCEMWNGSVAAGASFTPRSYLNGNIEESKTLSATGLYDANCGETGNGPLAMMATFKAPTLSSPAAVMTSLASDPILIPKMETPRRTRPNGLRALACSPRTVNAGGRVTCEVQVEPSARSQQLQLASSSELVKVPETVIARPHQSRLSFQMYVDSTAKQQAVNVKAVLDRETTEDTILVASSARPVLMVPNKQFAKYGTPLRFRVQGMDPLELPIRLTAEGVPPGAVFDPQTGQFEWTPIEQAGEYQVKITATNTAGQFSTAQVIIDVDSGRPVLSSSDVLACSPGGVGTLNGKWLVTSAETYSDPTGNAMELGGSTVRLNGKSVGLIAATQARIHFLCPAMEPGEHYSIDVETGSGASEAVNGVMQTASPEILSLDGTDGNQGVISFEDMNTVATERNYRIAGYPAQPGDELLIWGTGFGLGAGRPGTVVVRFNGIDAQVGSVRPVSGRAGIYAIPVRVPASTASGDAVPVQVQVVGQDGKLFSSNIVTVAIEPVSQ